jgi:hypothetical protein
MTRQASLADRWGAWVRRPFPLLVTLSMRRIFHGSNAGEEEVNLSMGVVLALLALPGGFVSLFLFDKYGSFLQWLRGETGFDPLAAASPDEYFFIVLSMVVTAGVAVWWWDSIFPDRRDFANLVPLPLPLSRIFLANAVAIVILTCLFALDVNAASSLLFPVVVGASQARFEFIVRFAFAHAVVVLLASIFSFFAVFAMAGLLMLFLPSALFRRISLYVRTLLVTALLLTLSSSFAVPSLILQLPRRSRSALRFLPPAWFLGLCQWLRGRADGALIDLARNAILGLIVASVLAVAAYALSYRRCFIRLPEIADTPPGHLGTGSRWIFRALDGIFLRTPMQRAGYRFVWKTLLRNETHALAVGGFAGLGAVLASQILFSAFSLRNPAPSVTAETLSVPLTLSYCVLIGIRFVFDVPAHYPANWIFRFLPSGGTCETSGLALRVMLSSTLPWIFLAAFPICLHFWGWRVALLDTMLTTIWVVSLSEILLIRFGKLPFTCRYPAFRHSAVVVVLAYVLGYFAFAGVTSELEAAAIASPVAALPLVALSLAVGYSAHRIRRTLMGSEERLLFEDEPDASFAVLHLSDGN